MRKIKISTDNLVTIRDVNPKMMSYNVEMTEVTGGTFWKAYTPAQIAGTEEFSFYGDLSDFTAMSELMQYFPPIDLYDEKLRYMAKQLGSCWVRVSGSWATKTYFDLDNTTNGIVPEGYASILTKEQWIGVLDFIKAIGGKLLVSVSNCEGDHKNRGEYDLTQTKKIFEFSHNYGVDIDAVEFMNEPNFLEMSGAPKGYTSKDYVRDHDIFNSWVKENYPDCLIVGPCTTDGIYLGKNIGKLSNSFGFCNTDNLLSGFEIPLDAFSYHYYNGGSERLVSIIADVHWDENYAHTDEYLNVSKQMAENMAAFRDKYVPGGQMWVTESGDAVGGGNTWASTYLDVFRTLNELGSFAQITDGVIFHNTLASSDYGFLKHGTFEPRPNYFAVLLWNKLMGNTVYETTQSSENLHIYCHSRKDGKAGCVYLVINNSLTESVAVDFHDGAQIYTLTGGDNLRSNVMYLNGNALVLNEEGLLPELCGAGANESAYLPPASCTFIVL